ncbi:rRNA maturation RNase YbeY [candidate division WWE3 bacterium]|nr:rRNA maturation RNase YbeY [candidate division WWE3 bacterium]
MPILDNNKIYISISITGDKKIKSLNKKYRNKDYSTDVLSFNIDTVNEDGVYYLGDIIINKEQAARQAKDFGNSIEEEISDLAGHGVLHLLGVHHDGDDH